MDAWIGAMESAEAEVHGRSMCLGPRRTQHLGQLHVLSLVMKGILPLSALSSAWVH